MKYNRSALEAEFMALCRSRGPLWIESVVRPLRLPGDNITVEDIPIGALRAVAGIFRCCPISARGI
jgi:hypothetical protein